jgi:hypothetical protein
VEQYQEICTGKSCPDGKHVISCRAPACPSVFTPTPSTIKPVTENFFEQNKVYIIGGIGSSIVDCSIFNVKTIAHIKMNYMIFKGTK